MAPTKIGFGKVGYGQSTGCARTGWIFDGRELGANGVAVKITDNADETVFNGLDDTKKVLFGKKSGDPRIVRNHTIELSFRSMNHELVNLIEQRKNFFGDAFYVKFYQYDYRDVGKGGSDKYDAAPLKPATPSSSMCALWFLPFRNISNDSGDGPFLYVNGILTTSGISWSYQEGSVLFSTAKSSSSDIRAYFVWKPKTVFIPSQTQIVPIQGHSYKDMRYEIVCLLEEI